MPLPRKRPSWLVWLGLAAVVALAAGGACAHRDGGAPGTEADGGRSAVVAPSGATDARVPYTMMGVYRCCAPGAGTSCCADTARGMCFQNGGIYGQCRGAGESFDAKVICSGCCDGLTRIPPFVEGNVDPPEVDGLPAGCDRAGIDSVFVCAHCGDGMCGVGENRCNCPVDCK